MRYVVYLLIVGLVVYALIDCARTPDDPDRYGLPKIVWILLIVLTLPVGAAAWLVVSRTADARAAQTSGGRAATTPRRPSAPRRPLAPDDDPEFLAGLDLRGGASPGRPRDDAPGAGDGAPPSRTDEPRAPAPEDGEDTARPEDAETDRADGETDGRSTA